MGNNQIAVEISGVTKKFGEVVAVDNVSIKIKDGEFFSLLGPSGCGKTTTLRMIGGFEMPTDGEVYIMGEAQGFKPPYQRPVNTVFQSYALFPHMTIAQNIAFGLEMQKVPKAETKKRVDEMLELVQLPGMGRRKPKQLSGGQRQRIALARALINHPKVLLLDEPLGALDLKLRKEMQLELKAIQERVGITFVYVTHDQEEAITMSDRIAIINKGKVLQLGSPEEIYEEPANHFVADFIGETNFIPGKVRQMGSTYGIEISDGQVLAAGWVEEGVSIGETSLISVRPEKLRIYPSEQSPEYTNLSKISGTIEHSVYIGTDTRYVVRLTEETVVQVRQQNMVSGGTHLEKGMSVNLFWDSENARILKR